MFALLVVTASALLDLRTQILSAQAERDALQAERDAQLQINADLQDAVDNSDDPDRQADIARTSCGWLLPAIRSSCSPTDAGLVSPF